MRISTVFPAALLVASVALAGAAQAQSAGEPVSPTLTPSITQGEAGAASAYAWAGTWFSNKYAGGYAGALKALNDTNDLWSDGLVLRLDASGGSYRFDSMAFPDLRVGMLDADVMLGYRLNIDKGTFSAYLGPDVIWHDNPDPTAHLRGSEVGARIGAEYSGPLDEDFEGYLQGSYATSFDTYYLTGRLLYRASDTISIGPLVTLYGNRDPYQESTFGPFLKISTNFGEIGFSGGYRHVYTSGNPDGYFASAYLGFPIE